MVAAHRVRAMRTVENALRRWGFARVAGVDEVGRGCLAGPVVASAVVLNPDRHIARLELAVQPGEDCSSETNVLKTTAQVCVGFLDRSRSITKPLKCIISAVSQCVRLCAVAKDLQ